MELFCAKLSWGAHFLHDPLKQLLRGNSVAGSILPRADGSCVHAETVHALTRKHLTLPKVLHHRHSLPAQDTAALLEARARFSYASTLVCWDTIIALHVGRVTSGNDKQAATVESADRRRNEVLGGQQRITRSNNMGDQT